jgi:hypothetical protein
VVKIEVAESDFFTDFLINSINFLIVLIFLMNSTVFFSFGPADPAEFHRFSKKPAAFLNSAPACGAASSEAGHVS